jgi:hypothetical protein
MQALCRHPSDEHIKPTMETPTPKYKLTHHEGVDGHIHGHMPFESSHIPSAICHACSLLDYQQSGCSDTTQAKN